MGDETRTSFTSIHNALARYSAFQVMSTWARIPASLAAGSLYMWYAGKSDNRRGSWTMN
jgi:hypothetical protein